MRYSRERGDSNRVSVGGLSLREGQDTEGLENGARKTSPAGFGVQRFADSGCQASEEGEMAAIR